jgi:HK97 family phage prohead protease
MKTEIRNFELRAGQAGDPDYVLRGRAVTYGAMSSDLGGFRERIARGAFTRSLASGRDVVCTMNHSADHILGRSKNGTLTLHDGDEGLDFRCQLDPNQTAHRDLWQAVKRRDLDQCSFAFSIDDDGESWDECDDDDDNDQRSRSRKRIKRRTVTRAKLFDCSVVASPAYPGDATSVTARAAAPVAGIALNETALLHARAAKLANDIRMERCFEDRAGLPFIHRGIKRGITAAREHSDRAVMELRAKLFEKAVAEYRQREADEADRRFRTMFPWSSRS